MVSPRGMSAQQYVEAMGAVPEQFEDDFMGIPPSPLFLS